MNKRRNLIIVFTFLSLLVITMALSAFPSGGVASSHARGYGGSGIFSLLAETPLPDFLNAFLPLVMHSWPSPTPTPTATLTPTPTVTPTPTQPTVDSNTKCNSPGTPIQYSIDAVDFITVPQAGTIQSMEVELNITHSFVNDLIFTLRQESTSKLIKLIERPITDKGFVCTGNNIDVTLLDNATDPVDSSCDNSDVLAISGFKRPTMLLLVYNNEQMAGNWRLTVSDQSVGDDGTLDRWCLKFQYTE